MFLTVPLNSQLLCNQVKSMFQRTYGEVVTLCPPGEEDRRSFFSDLLLVQAARAPPRLRNTGKKYYSRTWMQSWLMLWGKGNCTVFVLIIHNICKIYIFISLFSTNQNQYMHIYKSKIMADGLILLSTLNCCSLYWSLRSLFRLNTREISL